jgi:voltage-gated potassium channel
VTLRNTVHHFLDGEEPALPARLCRAGLATLIVANVAAVALETLPALATYTAEFAAFESFSLTVFTLEFLTRLWAAKEDPHVRHSRWRWLGSVPALIDVAAILPGLLMAIGVDLRMLRIVRLLRIVRIAKLGRYSVAVQTLGNVLRAKSADLLSLLFLLVILLVVSSTLMFHLEHEAQPRLFSSIPATMWWGVVTLTTIGYGDLAPVTAAGRALGGIVAVLGIGMFALPAGLLGAAFVDELAKARARLHHHSDGKAPHCPHCGGELPKH